MGKPSLLPLKLVEQHTRGCRHTSRCGLCRWHLKRKDWLRGLQDSRWAKVAIQGKLARVGCTFCHLAEAEGPWANFGLAPLSLKAHCFKRHENSETHKTAATAFKTKDAAVFAPPANEFSEALSRMSKGGSCRDGKCMSDKRTQMRWCLSEACLSLARERLRTAESIAVMRDERNGRLLLRYRACLPNLQVVSGVLGFRHTQGFADSIGEATKKSVLDFCTPGLSPPRQFKQPESEVDRALLKNIQTGTQILITDAAAPELLASRILSGQRKQARTGQTEDWFTNIKLVGRDAAHASCRLLKRPFDAHPELKALLAEFVTATDSFSQKIQHSPLYQQWWSQSLAELNDNAPAKNLSAAKHRFASFLNPLSKICKNMAAMIQVCHKIATVRSDESSAWAPRLLQNFTGHKAILLGLVADAACTCNDLTRWLDQEDSDICMVNSQVQAFVSSLRTLFGSKKVLELPTYTKHVLDELPRKPIQILHGCAREVKISQQDVARGMKTIQVACFEFCFFWALPLPFSIHGCF